MGNTVLETEVLELFRRQMRLYYGKLRQAQSAAAPSPGANTGGSSQA